MFRKAHNNAGIVLITVLMVIMVMIVYVIGILSVSTSEVSTGKGLVERIKAEQLAKGAFWFNYTSMVATNSVAIIPDETLDDKTYSTTAIYSAGGGPNDTSSLNVITSY